MKKKIGIFILLIFFIIIAILFLVNSNNSVEILEQDKKFKISKIHYYSSASGINNSTSYQNPEWNLNLYQYTDIAIYIERLDTNIYIDKIYIDNIEINTPKKGNAKLYYLNPLNFGKKEFYLENEVTSDLQFNIINSENKENDVSYGIPVFFEDFSNPITLKYVNNDIIKNYKINNTETLNFDGSILKQAGVKLNDIKNEMNFNINIVTKDDKIHTVNISIDIPLENEDIQIFNGAVEKKENKLNIEF